MDPPKGKPSRRLGVFLEEFDGSIQVEGMVGSGDGRVLDRCDENSIGRSTFLHDLVEPDGRRTTRG